MGIIMRYTEKEYDFKFDSVYDFIRILFSTTFLAPFRFFNEMSKKIIFLGKNSVKEILNTAVIIAALLLAGELGYQLLIGKLSLLSGNVPLIAVVLALLGVFGLSFKVDDFNLEELDIFEECESVEPKPIVEEVMEVQPNTNNTVEEVVEEPIVNSTPQEESPVKPVTLNNPVEAVTLNSPVTGDINEKLRKYDFIMDDEVATGDVDDMLDLFDINPDDILDSVSSPLDEASLTETFANNTKELLGDSYEEEKVKFDMLADEMSALFADDTKDSINVEPIEEFESMDDFSLEDYVLD